VLLKKTIDSEADPQLLTGQLTEEMADAVAKGMPAEKQREVSGATFQLLYDRLQAKELPGTFVPIPVYFCNTRDILIRADVETGSG